ncbi:transcription factor IIA (TFIIA) subunit alpha, putative [Candida dubliniensis CD36]|uniref:Transcription initiation factor IIA large subunit n=1 Tax=Candida dubliniensis (strain CD36 / ATCC MYA-646 / CBS 7987 / NCPF 3949 / NRRL Y-17841) TaxID=573826 RepID=B9WG02_CANDC|nr:transcription factor IIA (TFIIA) subunit alpha, putative [Candida dubliniensis CD36]CAX42171.1 transcription factor IIA (TFIIA) subunit alpha, putative [Candida dubliniensis CD36]
MSNIETSKLYESVIEDVINDSRQDFENNGIDESTLQELRRIWCEKLTQSGVAKFSWDEDEEEEEEEADVDVEVGQAAQQPEQQTESNDAGTSDSGATASGTSAVNTSATVETNVKKETTSGNDLEVPDAQLSYNTTDNLGIEIPSISREKAADGDDHGLIVPKIEQADGAVFFETKKSNKQLRQVDGESEFEEFESDGDLSDDINSELDSESDKEEDEEDEEETNFALCLFDKVQRIKNKWKSTLVAGIANINGKDYVFHKANGESEW